MNDTYLQLDNVGVTYEGQSASGGGLVQWIGEKLSSDTSRVARPQASYKIDALKGVSIDIRHGERVGLIGLNGAGKSTLLKVMAGIYPPSRGSIASKGLVCPMFEFATGFEMTQSGWDNIRIRGLLLGMSRDEVEAKLPEIAEFTELGEFLDYPVRTYSSGMFIRLAFAVSTSLNPEILLIDEVMGAGDVRFAAKAKQRMFKFMEQGKILVFSSHDFSLLKSLCSRTIWLEKGVVMDDGPSERVIEKYRTAG